jgi:hypothetical protein
MCIACTLFLLYNNMPEADFHTSLTSKVEVKPSFPAGGGYSPHLNSLTPFYDWSSSMFKDSSTWLPATALDFCQFIGARQHARDPVQAVPLEAAEVTRLDELLASYQKNGRHSALEEQARLFLVTYREREFNSRVLSDAERRRLDELLTRPTLPIATPIARSPRTISRGPITSWNPRFLVVTVVSVVLVTLGIGISVVNSWHSDPPTGTVQQHVPPQNVAPAATDLQNFKQNYGPFRQLTPSAARPQTDAPALLFLEDSGYFVSTKWIVAPGSSGWAIDIAGNVNNVAVNGSHIDITDANGTPYIVGVDQAFVVSSNPGTVLRIDPTGNVFSMSLAQATAVRSPLK